MLLGMKALAFALLYVADLVVQRALEQPDFLQALFVALAFFSWKFFSFQGVANGLCVLLDGRRVLFDGCRVSLDAAQLLGPFSFVGPTAVLLQPLAPCSKLFFLFLLSFL